MIGILAAAIVRLTPLAVEAYSSELSTAQWIVAGGYCVFMAYTEGYRGFQVSFSPRTAARIRHLRDRPVVAHAVLAPLFAMGFFHATRRTKIMTWMLTTSVVILIVLVQRLDQPWRGIVDSGVVVGLAWGVLSLAASIVRSLTATDYAVSARVPRGEREG